MKLYELTANQVKGKILSGEISAQLLIEDLLKHIEKTDPAIGAYITLNAEKAISRAKEIDKKIALRQPVGTLAGVPIAIKDNICTEGIKTTCASKILENFIPTYNAHVIERINNEDGIIIGKTNLDEFAMGSSTENSAFHITRNPWDMARVPGGSSGGSAAAISADMAFLSLGSDTGGSVRQPAAFCGVVGLKPTYGRVSRYGLVAFASSLDQVGTIAKDVLDTALFLQVIAGHDRHDSTSSTTPVPNYIDQLDDVDNGILIGMPKEFFGNGLNEEINKAIRDALEILKGLGAKIIEISLPHTAYAIATYYIIATAEASSNLARYDGVRYGLRSPSSHGIIDMYCRSRSEGFGNEVKRRIMLGNYVLSAGFYDTYYLKASKVRTLIRMDFESAFQDVDCIICPTSPVAAFKFGENISNPLGMYLVDVYTNSANLAGIPGISIPCGFTANGLPIGMQILGKHFDELKILKIARMFEKETGYHKIKPKLKQN